MANPQYEQAPTVAPAAAPPFDYQTERPTPASFGGLIGAAEQRAGAQTQQGGGDLIQAGILRQERFNQVAADDAWNQFQAGTYKLTYGDPNNPQQPGIYGLHGRDAMDAMPHTAKAIDDLRQQITGGLQNDAQRIQFDQASRRLQMFTMDAIGRHVDQQANVWATGVNDSGISNARLAISANYNDDQAFLHNMEDMKSFAVQKAQTLYGHNLTPEMTQRALSSATSDAIQARVEAWAPNNPGAAETFLKTNQKLIAPNVYDHLTSLVQGHAQTQDVQGRTQAIMNGQTSAPARWPANDLHSAIQGQEGSGPQAVSVAGAVGKFQVTPGFFQTYARPGENFASEADREAVAKRGIDTLSAQYGGDPARVAVAYFSGPQGMSRLPVLPCRGSRTSAMATAPPRHPMWPAFCRGYRCKPSNKRPSHTLSVTA